MNLDGSNHRKVKEISFGTIDLSQGYGYSWSINGNYLLVEVSRYEENANIMAFIIVLLTILLPKLLVL